MSGILNLRSSLRKFLFAHEEHQTEIINPRKLAKDLGIERLNHAAEEYYQKISDLEYYLAKPFAIASETPHLLVPFTQILQGLSVVPGLTVLDFGAGSCWASRFLTQLGCEVIALDVSSTALKIGQELYKKQPIIGKRPEPQFIQFDGRKIELPSGSVDRIICLDALHHVPNLKQVLREMARVLKEGGIAAFSEPGPNHSRSPKSQHEMRLYGILENDIDLPEIWDTARKVGFTDLKLSVFNPNLFLLSIEEFKEYLERGQSYERYAEETRRYVEQHSIFFLYKGNPAPPDSRQHRGLLARLEVNLKSTRIERGQNIMARVKIANIGSAVWLPTSAPKGPVNLGTHLLTSNGKLINLDYSRHSITGGAGRPILPGESILLDIIIPPPNPGEYILEFDLVSEGVCWFGQYGSETVRIPIEVF
jgi:ubiquinone/menaquinone biosynthesis C-methylase UbiE